MSDKPLMRYDAATDELIPVTQEWVVSAQRRLLKYAIMRGEIRKLVNVSFVEVNSKIDPIFHTSN